MTVHIRGLDERDFGSAMQTFTAAMQFAPLSGAALENAKQRGYPERSFGAFDGTTMVGNTRSYPFGTIVPGGALVPTAGITAVGTLPTHRRRGILSRLMATQLRACFEQGEPIASLRASEAVIYGRFGYGLAGHANDVRVKTRTGGFRHRVADDGTFQYERGEGLLATLPELHRRCLRRPGELDRPLPIWRRSLAAHLKDEQDEGKWLVVHRDRRGRPDGFVEWEAIDRDHWHDKPATIRVGDLYGISTEVEALMWQFLLDLDLIEQIESFCRPVDDPVRWRMADTRSYTAKETWDEQWLRVVDVRAALAVRTYNPVDTTVVVGVTDAILPENDGGYEIGSQGVRRVRRAAELDVPIDSLGAIYLGGTSVAELVAAGRIGERRKGAAARADLLFRSVPAPWSGTFF